MLGGVASREGLLDFTTVIAAVAIGTWIATQALYFLGRWRVTWVRTRFSRYAATLDNALGAVQRNPWRAALAVRFAYGLRLPLPIACGVAHVPIWLFSIASALSCMAWAALFTWLGWRAGEYAINVLHFTERWDVRLAVVALLLMGVLYYLFRSRRIEARTTEFLTRESVLHRNRGPQ